MRIRIAFAVAVLACPTVASVAAASTEGNANACFGQARSSSVRALTDSGSVVGRDFFSERKGDNAQMNADYKATVCGK